MTSFKKGGIYILSSPSGAGKTTLVKKISKNKNFSVSISHTTRLPRPNEKNGKDYFFVTKDKFNKLAKKNFFIETAKNFNNYYGSPYSNIKKAKKNKNILLFDIDWKGARKIRKNYNSNNILDFFILPPSKNELKKRLIRRGRDNMNEISLRLSYAINEMKHFNEYKYILINENVHKTVKDIIKIIEYNKLIQKNQMLLNKNLKKIIKI